MQHQGYGVSIGDQVFIDGNDEEIGAVRKVSSDQLIVYVENAGDFVVRAPHVKAVHDGKLILDPEFADPALLDAARQAHDRETD